MSKYDLEVKISKRNDALVKDESKCIQCGYCKQVCTDEITVARMFEVNEAREPVCINCGQCANVCPTEAISERMEYVRVQRELENKKKTVTFNIAPAVRVAILEEFGLEPGINAEGKIVTALKQLGADYVFDVTFGADLTIMEEAMELVSRIKNQGVLPQFTSCCPAWVKYCEIFYPELLPNLSSCKSPIAMQGALIKTFFAKNKNLNPSEIFNVAIAPCTAKKSEMKRPEMSVVEGCRDMDGVLTTRELAKMVKEAGIDLKDCDDSPFDSPLGKGSSAGTIFGNTGGVAEAALRTAYTFLTGENLKQDDLVFEAVRGMEGIKEAKVNIVGKEIKVAVCNGMKNAKIVIDRLLKQEVSYDFIEVMNCYGGCIGGGGQPKITLLNMESTKRKRVAGIYSDDEKRSLRLCHENPEIKAIYADFLGEPNSEIAEKLLHTHYHDQSALIKGENMEAKEALTMKTDVCESCVTKPCQVGCPLNNDITGFIRLMKEEKFKEAYDLLTKTTVLPALCGRICPHFKQCQSMCVKGVSYTSVPIGELEAYLADKALIEGWSLGNRMESINKRVAIVGGGPSGLTCAAFLARAGVQVTLYEKHNYLGGIMVHGIPEFRLPKEIIDKAIQPILDLGVEVKLNHALGKEIHLEELESQYDAVYLGFGANLSSAMNIEGENLDGVYGGNELLENQVELDYHGKTVIVSGGGNVAMDVSRTAKMKGAERVIVVYRRSEKEMPAEVKEIEEAKEEGVEFFFQKNILRVVGENSVTGIEVVSTKLVAKEGETRLSPVNIEGSNEIIPCDYVMMAVGSHAEKEVVESLGVELDRRGKVVVNASRTSKEKVFAGGDLAGSKGTVAWAARAGRDAAEEILKALK